jgi:hypothetical protein
MMMNRLICAALFCVTTVANALTYVESVDLPDNMSLDPSASVGALDVGSNTVSGALNGVCILAPGGCNSATPGDGDTQDSFLLTVQAGTQLRSLVLSSVGTVGPKGFSANFYLTDESWAPTVNVFIPINGVSPNLLDRPLGPGVYSLTVFGQVAVEPGAFVLPYTLSLEVSAVPEPETAVLLLCGGLLLAIRRRQSAA